MMNEVHFSWKLETALVHLAEAVTSVLTAQAKKIEAETPVYQTPNYGATTNEGELK